MVCEKLMSHLYPLPGGTSGVKEPIKGRKMNLQNRATRSIDLEGNEAERIYEGKASRDSGKGEDSNPEEEQSPSPTIKTQMVLLVKELPHFEGMKREDFITFMRHVGVSHVKGQELPSLAQLQWPK